MQNNQNPFQNPGKRSAGFGFFFLIFAIENRFNHLNIPITERSPDKLIDRIGRVRKTESVKIVGNLPGRLFGLGDNPFVDGAFDFAFIKVRRKNRFVHFAETGGIPELGGKIAVTSNTVFAHVNMRFHRRHKEAQRVSTVFFDGFHRVNGVALGLGHLTALLVADQTVDIAFAERNFFHHVHAHHHHSGNPEENDIKAGYQN